MVHTTESGCKTRRGLEVAAQGRFRAPVLAWILVGCFGLGGCYDGQALVEFARNEALQARLQEIDLGTYRTSLPHDPDFAAVEFEFQIFGQAPRYRAPQIKQQLQQQRYRLRYGVITVVRQTTAEEFTQPDLAALKERLRRVANELLADAPIVAVGFKELRFEHR